jgi:SAM-dependent methyltransferase
MQGDMRAFWDRRAKEDAFFFVDNRLAYRDPDPERFWADGERDLDALLGAFGAHVKPTDTVLEVGCGIGRLTRVLAARAASVKAIDVSPRMLEAARKHNTWLDNVDWILGDGSSLARIDTATVDACVSHVVFQHIPDPAITVGYVVEIGRVLRPCGWAVFQVSNDPRVHLRAPRRARIRPALATLAGSAPRGQADARWRGSMVGLDELRGAVTAGSMDIERIVGEGTQMCCVLTRRKTEVGSS